jgi:shikimate kinase
VTPVVVLVGPPGAGKTTVGQLVASALGLTLLDTDVEVEQAAGKSIADIFIDHGEPHFRALERTAVSTALTTHDGVVAVGGGAVLNEATREQMRSHRVVFLDVNLANAAARIGLNRDRPLLLGDVRGRLRRLLAERQPLYDEVATVTVSTNDRQPAEVADHVIAVIRQSVR